MSIDGSGGDGEDGDGRETDRAGDEDGDLHEGELDVLEHAGPVRHPPRRREPDPRRFVSCWSESDELDGKMTRAWVLILRTSGCSWASCTMCGYHGEAAPATGDDLVHQFTEALGRRRDERIAKVYTSGSFLDQREVPSPARRHILGELGKRFDRVVIESRPEHVTAAALDEASGLCPGLEVAMGLESSSQRVLDLSVRKGFTFGDFAGKARLAREHGARVRAYILLKPPFLSEKEALDDAVQSMLDASPLCDVVSLNPVNVQRGTVAERLWRRRIFRPPWLWTAATALLDAQKARAADGAGPRLVCAPSGAGQRRGAHNCGLCDAAVTAALEEFSLSRDPAALEKALSKGCECIPAWRDALAAGAFPFIPYDGLQEGR